MSYSFVKLTLSAEHWNVTIEQVRETEGSLLAFGARDGKRVVLKVTKRAGDEWNSGEVLKAFEGDGAVRVYESEGGAVLLERLDPGTELVELVRAGQDEEATAILAQVIRVMSNHKPPVQSPTVADWALGFDRYLSKATEMGIPFALAQEAAELYRRLEASQKQTMLLHGDLHHYNILFDTDRGWVSIDPKGVVGELEYEVGAMVRNPIEQPDLFTQPEVIERRLQIVTATLNLDYHRALQWSFAQAVLSAIWSVEDGFEVLPDHPTLQLAEVLRPMLS